MKIGLVYDLRDQYLSEGFSEEQVAEFDSQSTIDALAQAIGALGHEVDPVGHGRSLAIRLVAGERWDLVFSIAEGLSGRSREAQVPALLELYQVPYVFSDPLACALTLDKALTKRVVRSFGLHTAAFTVVTDKAEARSIDLPFPLFAKPLAEGTGKGVDSRSRISTQAELEEVCIKLLERFKQPVLVEEYLPGREFTTALIGTGSDAKVLGTMEFTISPDAPASDYSYEVKELCEDYVAYFPMPQGSLRQEVERLALEVHRCLELRDTSRVDIRLDARNCPAFIEVNPLPGLHPSHSDLPMIANQAGISYEELIGAILESALKRQKT
jgi:D-alanine-D-alanine ligase